MAKTINENETIYVQAAKEILEYLAANRANGQTRLIKEGTDNFDSEYVGVAIATATAKETFGGNGLTIANIANHALRGHSKPIAIEETALQYMLQALVNENVKLSEKTEALARELADWQFVANNQYQTLLILRTSRFIDRIKWAFNGFKNLKSRIDTFAKRFNAMSNDNK